MLEFWISSWQTCCVACLTAVASPLAAFWQMSSSLVFTLADSVGCESMLDLQAVTAAWTAGLAAAAPEGAVVAVVDGAAVVEPALEGVELVLGAELLVAALDVELLELLLLEPQPVISAPPATTVTSSKVSLRVIAPPMV